MLNKDNSNHHTHQSDEEAEAAAADARRRGTELVASHLTQHLEQNPDSSYVTWIACLHPENAEVTIDERFFVPNNPWWTVYEEAKADIPTATATLETSTESEQALTVSPGSNDSNPDVPTPEHKRSERTSCLDMIFGCTFCLIAILTVFLMEFTAYICYLLSAVFYLSAKALDPPNACTGIFYSLFLLVYWTLALVDSFVLLTSVLVTEIFAGSLWLVSCVFGNIRMAFRWHQYLRRTCHLLRWAFRSKSLSAYPPRQLCCVCLADKKDPEELPTTVQDYPSNEVTDKEMHWTQARIEACSSRNTTTLTPSAPPSTDDVVIVLDERDVILESDHAGSNQKDNGW